MKIASIFISLVFATTFLSNLQHRADQARSGLREQANYIRSAATEKFSTVFSKAKKLFKKITRSEDSKESTEEKKKADENDEYNLDSTTLNEFLKRFQELMAKNQQEIPQEKEGAEVEKSKDSVESEEEKEEL